MKLRLSAFIPLGLVLVIGIFSAFGLKNDPRALPSMMIDRGMPTFNLEAVIPNEPVFENSDLHGKISLINVFGSWCAACVQEHPTLMRLARENRVTIYGVDWRDTAKAGHQWLVQYGNPYTKVGLDAQSRLAVDLGVTGAPETFIVDAKSRIRFKYIGPITEEVWTNTIEPVILSLEQGT